MKEREGRRKRREPTAPDPRKSNRVASKSDRKGKTKVVYPKNPNKKKNLPKIGEVPRKKRKLLDSWL